MDSKKNNCDLSIIRFYLGEELFWDMGHSSSQNSKAVKFTAQQGHFKLTLNSHDWKFILTQDKNRLVSKVLFDRFYLSKLLILWNNCKISTNSAEKEMSGVWSPHYRKSIDIFMFYFPECILQDLNDKISFCKIGSYS